jgi:hypothetical protein
MVLAMTAAVAGAQMPTTPVMTQDQQTEFEYTHLISAETGLFDIHFSLNGQEIASEKDLEKIIASADDEKALQDLKGAEDRSSLGWVLTGSGSAMLVVGALASWNNNNGVLFNVLALGGLVTDLIGGIVFRESQSEKLDAVDRYNEIIREDNGISFLNLPDASMALAYVQRF